MDAAVGYMQASGTEHRRYLFGEFVLDVDRGALLRAGADVPLRPKSFEVLNYLVLHAGLLVSKEKLLAEIWHGVVVTDDSLTHCLIDIRKALGDDSREMVRTVRGRGYLFDLPVSTPDPGEGLIEHGFLRNNRRSSRRWAGIAVALLLAVVTTLWLLIDEDIPKAILVVQNEDTAAIAASGKEQALEHYLQGKFFNGRRGPGDAKRAFTHFQRAVVLDPGLASAWVGQAGVLLVQVWEEEIPWHEGMARSRVALTKALALDSTNATAHVMMGQYQYWILGQDELAQEHFDKAWQYGRDSASMLSRFAGIALDKGDVDEALELQRQSVVLDSISYISRSNLAHLLYFAGYLEEARQAFLYAKILNPEKEAEVNRQLALILVLQEQFRAAELLLTGSSIDHVRDQAWAMIYHKLGETARAEEAIARLSASPAVESAVRLAEVYAFCGDFNTSLNWLNVAKLRNFSADHFQLEWGELQRSFYSPFLKPLQQDPRWLLWQSSVIELVEQSRSRSAQEWAGSAL